MLVSAAGVQSVLKSVRLACGRLGVRIPVATDVKKVVKTGSDSYMYTARCECHGFSMTILNGCPVSQ